MIGTSRASVVIVNYNGSGFLRDCLQSVLSQQPHEVILVDNASSDESVALVAEEFPSVRILVNPKNEGFAGGNNAGVAAANGDIVVLLNNDTVVKAGWLEPLEASLQNPAVGVVTSRVVTEGVPEEFYEVNGTINFLGYNIMRHFSDLSVVFFAGGASVAFRRKDVVYPFDPEYFLYHEDVFLSWRMRLKGMDVRMVQDSVVWHKGGGTTKREPDSRITFFQERNRLLNPMLFYQARTLFLLIPYFVADFLAKIALSILFGRKSFVGILRAYFWFVPNLSYVLNRRKELQSERKVTDREILRHMSTKVVESNSTVAGVLNGISMVYAKLTGLAPNG